MSNLCVFEDAAVANFCPLTYLRPVYEMRVGAMTLLEAIEYEFPKNFLYLQCRPYLKNAERRLHPDIPVNHLNTGAPCLFINGRMILNQSATELAQQLQADTVILSKGTLAMAYLSGDNLNLCKNLLERPLELPGLIQGLTSGTLVKEADLKLLQYPWDCLKINRELIKTQTQRSMRLGIVEGFVHPQAILMQEDQIFIGKDSRIGAHVVLDASEGPIWIDCHCEIEPLAYIQGPVSLGQHCHVKAHAQIRGGCSVGPFCKVGGEISNVIMSGYSNKSHDGFVGDSIFGAWVNLGAGTTTSNLKNNYHMIRSYLNGEEVETDMLFFGSTVGDYSKTGIGTLLQAGTQLGIFCNVFGGGLCPKFLPSFSWGSSNVEYLFEHALDTAKRMAERRGHPIAEADREAMYAVYEIFHTQRHKLAMASESNI